MIERRRKFKDPALRHRHHDLVKMSRGITMLLQGMGIDLKDPNYKGTPERVARMFHEMLSPNINNWAAFPALTSDLVILRNHKVIAICPHHLQPVEMSCFIGYIPSKKTIGLSKLGRVVEEQLVTPMLQEDLANAVAESLEYHLDPKGVGVVMKGVHGCMRFRGIRSHGDVVTSVMRGVLLLNSAARIEFLQLAGKI